MIFQTAAAAAVATISKVPRPSARLRSPAFGEDLELHFRTLIATGSNPTVAACVGIGIEPGCTGRNRGWHRKTAAVDSLSDRRQRRHHHHPNASRKALRICPVASEKQRGPVPSNTLRLHKVRGGDTTSGLAPSHGRNRITSLTLGRHNLLRRNPDSPALKSSAPAAPPQKNRTNSCSLPRISGRSIESPQNPRPFRIAPTK